MKRQSILKSALVLLLLQAVAIQAAITVTNIAQGCWAYHSLFLKSDGSLWVIGSNDYGQLGDSTLNNAHQPEEIVAGGVTATAAGGLHSLFLKSDGSLWAMGANSAGQLGDGTFNNASQAEEIVANGVTAIAAGGNQSMFLKSDGSLWVMGENYTGELGDGTFNNTNQPEEIVASGVVAIAAGGQHSLFLKSDGSLWAMGYNENGQLGDGITDSGYYETNQPEEIVANGVTAIAAGINHSLFLKSDGSLWAMGRNFYGQLGDGTYSTTFPYGVNKPEEIVSSGVTAIAAGGDHSLFIKSDGSLWAMGMNGWGQLGDGTFNNTNQPEEIVTSGVVAIAAGSIHSLFLKSNGSLWAMGDNEFGQLGDGFVADFATATPEQIFPPPRPVLAQTVSANTNLQFTATCGFRGNFYLLASTNIAQPLSLWTPVWTNAINSRGTNNFYVTLTNAVNYSIGQQFYILQSQ
ncbi:MAG: RCC1 domain-containing protein [Limisphaerales bacterium]